MGIGCCIKSSFAYLESSVCENEESLASCVFPGSCMKSNLTIYKIKASRMLRTLIVVCFLVVATNQTSLNKIVQVIPAVYSCVRINKKFFYYMPYKPSKMY